WTTGSAPPPAKCPGSSCRARARTTSISARRRAPSPSAPAHGRSTLTTARHARAATASGSSPSAATGRKAAFTWGSSGCVFELDAVAGKDLAGELLEHGHRLEVVRGRARLAEAALRQLVLARSVFT